MDLHLHTKETQVFSREERQSQSKERIKYTYGVYKYTQTHLYITHTYFECGIAFNGFCGEGR